MVTRRWIEITIGALLLISPWVLGFSDISVAKWCNVLFGLILVLIGAWAMAYEPVAKEEVGGKTATKHKK